MTKKCVPSYSEDHYECLELGRSFGNFQDTRGPQIHICNPLMPHETKLDKEKNQCIRQETGAQNIVKEIKQYQIKWLQHVQRMDTNRLPKQALQYKHRTTEEEMEGPTSP